MSDSERPAAGEIGWCVTCGTWSRGSAAVFSHDHWAGDPKLAALSEELGDPKDAWLCPGCHEVAWSHGIRVLTPEEPIWCPCAGQHADAQVVTWDGCPNNRMGERKRPVVPRDSPSQATEQSGS